MNRGYEGQEQGVHGEVLQRRRTAQAVKQFIRSFVRLHAYARVVLLVGYDFVCKIPITDKALDLRRFEGKHLKGGEAGARIVAITVGTGRNEEAVRAEKFHLMLDPANDFAAEIGVGDFVEAVEHHEAFTLLNAVVEPTFGRWEILKGGFD
jgi:hypothetical protein